MVTSVIYATYSRHNVALATLIAMASTAFPSAVLADTAADTAKLLANPVSALISVPIQVNYDRNIGSLDGERMIANVQPVIPFELNEEWNLISRTIVPIVSQENTFATPSQESGIGDTVQSLFFSPVDPTESGWIWGVGPAALLPTATNNRLGLDTVAVGPTAVVLKQANGWTYGMLANHLWSLDDSDVTISNTFVNPFVSYTNSQAVTFNLNTETTYDWENDQVSFPVSANVSKVISIGGQLISVGGGLKYWVEGPDSGPDGLAYRITVTFLFPR